MPGGYQGRKGQNTSGSMRIWEKQQRKYQRSDTNYRNLQRRAGTHAGEYCITDVLVMRYIEIGFLKKFFGLKVEIGNIDK